MPNPGRGGKADKATAKPAVSEKKTSWKPSHPMNPMPNRPAPAPTKPTHTMNPMPNKPAPKKPTHTMNPMPNPKPAPAKPTHTMNPMPNPKR